MSNSSESKPHLNSPLTDFGESIPASPPAEKPSLPTMAPANQRRQNRSSRPTSSAGRPSGASPASQDIAQDVEAQVADVAAPLVDTHKPIQRRPTLTREKFDEIRRASAAVDESSLSALQELPQELDPASAVTIVDTVTQHRKPLSSFMISVTFHLILFVTLALLMTAPVKPDPTIELTATLTPADPLKKAPVEPFANQTLKIELPEDHQSPEDSQFEATAVSEELKVAEADAPVPSPVVDVPTPLTTAVDQAKTSPEGAVPLMPTGGGLKGRDQASRAQRAAQRGGSDASEAAVESGLAWIIAHQHRDGSWRLKHDSGTCRGQCPNEGSIESTTAATGLALMALLGAGYTHKSGPYQQQVEAGLRFLIKSMRKTKRGGNLARGERGMYSHAIATIALAEAFAMTKDTWLAEPVESARYYIETAQHRRGGWRYNPGNAGDMTVTGWQIMALKSCQLGGTHTRKEVWANAEGFVDSLRTSSGWYGYQRPSEKPTTTAVAALMKMYLGAGSDNADVQTAAEYISAIGPSRTDMYLNYYGTQVMFHRGGHEWKRWNEKMRDHLVNAQDQSRTHRFGSWYFQDPHSVVGGRLYTTAMAIMTLEVYYRYLPLYDHDAVSDPLAADNHED